MCGALGRLLAGEDKNFNISSWETCPICMGDEGYLGDDEDGNDKWIPCSFCDGQGGWETYGD